MPRILGAINSVEAAKATFAPKAVQQLPQGTREDLSTKEPKLAKRLDEGECLVYKRDGRIYTAFVGRVFRSKFVLSLVPKYDLGYGGDPWVIVPKKGSAYITHDLWSEERIPVEFTSIFEEHINTLVCRRATKDEEAAWFAEIDLAELLEGAA